MSTAPSPYSRQANFVSYEASNPTTPKRGVDLDAEFNALRTTVNAVLNRLNEIQRDDGGIGNRVVHPDAFTSDALLLLGAGINPRGSWVTATGYTYRDLVNQGGNSYIALVDHVAGVFSTDLAQGKWQQVSSSPVAALIPFSPAGTIAATNVQAALQELDGDIQTKQAADPTLTAFAALTIGTNTLIYGNGPDAFAQSTLTALGRTLLAAGTAGDMRTVLELIKGTAAGNVVALNGSAQLPAVDGSLLTGVIPAASSVGATQLADTLNLSGKTITLPPALTTVFSKEYVSAEQTISNAGGATLAHGLSVAPKFIQVRLVCKTAENGYSINDEVIWGTTYQGSDRGVAVALDATNIIYKYINGATPFSYFNKSTGATTPLTNANWRMVIRAWA